MAICNFYIHADIDGRKTTVAGGPRNIEGGMDVRISQRDDGVIVDVIRVSCIARADGKLSLQVEDLRTRKVLATILTER